MKSGPRVAPYFYYLFPSTAYSATERGRRAHQARHEPAEAVDERRGAGSRPGGTVKNLTIDKNQSGKITGNWGVATRCCGGTGRHYGSEAPGRLPAPRRTERDHRQANRPRWLALSCLAARLREEMGIGDGYRVRGGAGCDHFGAALYECHRDTGRTSRDASGGRGKPSRAVGTALPESMIAIVAILEPVLTGQASEEGALIGIGAILGAPFMLATSPCSSSASRRTFSATQRPGMRLRADAATGAGRRVLPRLRRGRGRWTGGVAAVLEGRLRPRAGLRLRSLRQTNAYLRRASRGSTGEASNPAAQEGSGRTSPSPSRPREPRGHRCGRALLRRRGRVRRRGAWDCPPDS